MSQKYKNFLAISICLFYICASTNVNAETYVYVLGIAQDGGSPQAGCSSPFCERAWKDKKLQKKVSSIALVSGNKRWIFDATPDFPSQFQALKEKTGDKTNRLDGIFLTHAHIGHYTGLMHLGRESMNSASVPVYAMPRMSTLLDNSAPWSQLVSLKNIEIRIIEANRQKQISDRIWIEAIQVPHRDEFSETVGYRIITPTKKLLFIPDIDKWSKWNRNLKDEVRANDLLLLDGTFYADGEISRPMSEVPHPFVVETIQILQGLTKEEKARVFFTHFNHSNPLIQNEEKAIQAVKRAGFGIASEGLTLRLDAND